MKQLKVWLITFGITTILGLGAVAGLVILVDPFFQYHEPLSGFPYQVDDQLSQNPGMARNMEYDSVILGSSVTVNFSKNWFDEDFGCNTIKLPYNGAYPKDYANIMEQVDMGGQEIRYIFWGMDVQAFSSSTEETKYPIPEHLYDTNPLNDITYWFNKDVLLNYVLKPLMEPGDATDMAEVYATWELFGFNRWVLLQSYERPERSSETYPRDHFIEAVSRNMDENICPIIENHPDTEFYIFFPPYSILHWYTYEQGNLLEPLMEEYRYVIGRLLEYDNVRLYYFQNEESIVCDLNRYTDAIHYDREVSLFIEESIAADAYRLTKDNYLEEVEETIQMIEAYDFDSVWEN